LKYEFQTILFYKDKKRNLLILLVTKKARLNYAF